MLIRQIARVCYDVNSSYCRAIDDTPPLPWEDMVESLETGIAARIMNPNSTPADSHESWLAFKMAAGWKYGPKKDAVAKEHPCFLPYADLPPEQRAKDKIFTAIVDALKD